MSYDNSKTALATEPALRDCARESKFAALLQCLIVSARGERRATLRQAAVEGGWLPIVCGDVETAREEARRLVAPLAVVDLYDQEGRRLEGARRWVEQLAAEPDRVLAIIGSDADPLEEIWARQLGVWLFLPGLGDAAGLALVCCEAREAVGRLAPPMVPALRARRAASRAVSRRGRNERT